ncbi:MAG: DUF2384 domain-containing protein [Deltaproteobacteria bacterium]|nr:DUF2384 domain-containing protein [Deltaproteobacteria bacterium]
MTRKHAKTSAHGMLGLRNAPRDGLAWVAVIREGVAASVFEQVIAPLGWTLGDLSKVIAVPERTLHRHKSAGTRLMKGEAERLVRLTRVIERVFEVFEDWPKARAWLAGPIHGLGGAAPQELLDTDAGAAVVLDELGRLEHGIHS